MYIVCVAHLLHCERQKFEACCRKWVALYQWFIVPLYFHR